MKQHCPSQCRHYGPACSQMQYFPAAFFIFYIDFFNVKKINTIVVERRRVYFFTCTQCDKIDRQSYQIKRARTGLCKYCRGIEVNPNQMDIFGIVDSFKKSTLDDISKKSKNKVYAKTKKV